MPCVSRSLAVLLRPAFDAAAMVITVCMAAAACCGSADGALPWLAAFVVTVAICVARLPTWTPFASRAELARLVVDGRHAPFRRGVYCVRTNLLWISLLSVQISHAMTDDPADDKMQCEADDQRDTCPSPWTVATICVGAALHVCAASLLTHAIRTSGLFCKWSDCAADSSALSVDLAKQAVAFESLWRDDQFHGALLACVFVIVIFAFGVYGFQDVHCTRIAMTISLPFLSLFLLPPAGDLGRRADPTLEAATDVAVRKMHQTHRTAHLPVEGTLSHVYTFATMVASLPLTDRLHIHLSHELAYCSSDHLESCLVVTPDFLDVMTMKAAVEMCRAMDECRAALNGDKHRPEVVAVTSAMIVLSAWERHRWVIRLLECLPLVTSLMRRMTALAGAGELACIANVVRLDISLDAAFARRAALEGRSATVGIAAPTDVLRRTFNHLGQNLVH
jgi:hypothetical protein